MEMGSSSLQISTTESLNGLKLRSSSSSSSSSSSKSLTKQPPRCQVEGCSVDLSGAKAYYGRHKVCGMHSKSPMVLVAGLEQRFCQQCSRFHQLPEFDQDKRSCRRRLAGHNERRRKPQHSSLASQMPSSPSDDGNSRWGGFLMNFAYPQLAGIMASDQTTSRKWQGGTQLPASEGPGVFSLLSAQPRGNSLTGNPTPTDSTSTIFDGAPIISFDGKSHPLDFKAPEALELMWMPNELKQALERKRQFMQLDDVGN
ncbi:uncharacterized protein A4U43_UnF10520 [Asparagus officinalis]|uniref:SBP-type domain-containing protein n=1 Tax=Asparagus officinalis TaxID=4686 RepID=A0A1R3L5F4_ASPOF|nr:squamosa promoter-binding-like protein 17 [Asparagus officinalis]ONK54852.1 uncharacterized protein A4U43_UnF10520 [Asparagus officinalis]